MWPVRPDRLRDVVDAVLISMLISASGSHEPDRDEPFCCFGWEND